MKALLMQRQRVLLWAAALLILLALFLAGCAAEPEATEAPEVVATEAPEEVATEAPEPAEKVKIFGVGNTAWAGVWQDELVPAFNEEFPNIEVVVDGVPYADMLPKAMLDITADPGPYDFIATDDNWPPQMAETGLLLDLKNDLETPEGYDWDDFHPAPLAAGEWKGAQIAVPVRSNLMLMFYNRTLFEEAGLDADEELEGITWAEFEELLPKLVRDTDGDGEDDVWAIAMEYARGQLVSVYWQAILNSNGGKLFDEDMRPAFNTDVGVAAMEQYIRFNDYGPPGIEAYGFNEVQEAFRQQQVAIMFQWGSVYRAMAADPETSTMTPDQVGIRPLPGGSACPASSHRGIWIVTIPKNSPHPEEAWTYISWITSRAGEAWMAANIGTFPARISTLTSTPAEDWLVPVYQAINDGYDAIACGGMWRPRLADSDAVQRALGLQVSRTVLGEVTAAQALTDAENEILETLEDLGYYE
jgi:ABC-type glycerol-3-phosphate transport system substrate-binding protein